LAHLLRGEVCALQMSLIITIIIIII